jgi:hypothetical protein
VPLPDSFAMGGIVGSVRLVACVTKSSDPYFFGPYGFEMLEPRVLPFHAVRGQLGFFSIDYPPSEDTR